MLAGGLIGGHEAWVGVGHFPASTVFIEVLAFEFSDDDGLGHLDGRLGSRAPDL